MIIRNREELEITPQRKAALEIIEAGISRVLPENIMKTAVSYDSRNRILTIDDDAYPLKNGRLFVIGGGKASGRMAEVLESITGAEAITAGAVTCKTGSGKYDTKKIMIREAGHPVPDQAGIDGVKAMLDLKTRYDIRENDIVLCLISGGGSALMPMPVEGVSLTDKQVTTGQLLGCGADIHEINTVRKHLSAIKGGGLCRYFAPATVVSLILSDVIGNDLNVIASGPTSPDSSTFAQAQAVLDKYGLSETVPASVSGHIEKGCRGEIEDTPDHLENCRNYIIGDNRLALEAMSAKAEESGFKAVIVTAEQKGKTGDAARFRAAEIVSGVYSGYNAIILGGETTPILPADHGKGGRNQHFAAVTLRAMEAFPGTWTLASVGTDGSDFLADVAGAIVDNHTLKRAVAKGIDTDHLTARHDSFTLFRDTGGSLVKTGSTGTNVGDIMVYLLG